MEENLVICVSNVSKRYRIGLTENSDRTFINQIISLIKAPFTNLIKLRNLSRFGDDSDTVFWALDNISFSVTKGEKLGVIGRNGAGKSTLLKVLSRITEPTSGEILIKGRVSSLLEVGTGFHPDLTGRENIYMNGTILGMRKREIDSKLDEIIEFSGISNYIDTPVKRYSSGMKVRLAFAVAAHLEPDVLIIDEVLAVGDAEFQTKCLGKMDEVASSGRTVLFVSHDMAAVRALCTRCVVLDEGKVFFNGLVDDAINMYLSQRNNICIAPNTRFDLSAYTESDRVKLNWIELISVSDMNAICTGKDLKLSISFEVIDQTINKDKLKFAITFREKQGTKLCVIDNLFVESENFNIELNTISFLVQRLPLLPDQYRIDIWVAEGGAKIDYIFDKLTFEVIPFNFFGHSKIKTRDKHGIFVVDYLVSN